MKRAIVLYQAPVSAMAQMAKATPAQAKAGMAAWMAWRRKAGDSVAELGAPLGNEKTVSPSGVSASQTGVVGFSILQGESLEQITGLLKDHPHLHLPGALIKVFEAMQMPATAG